MKKTAAGKPLFHLSSFILHPCAPLIASICHAPPPCAWASFWYDSLTVSKPTSKPNIAVLACEVFEIELKQVLSSRPHVRRFELMDWGLHNEPKKMPAALSAKIAEIEADPQVDAIVLAYGVCSRGTEGVGAQRVPVIMPRAHDCITVLLGSKERYADYVKDNPGTYWYSPGWNKHHLAPGPDRYAKLRAQYVEKFGEEDADFLMEQEQAWFGTYSRATYVHLTIGQSDADRAYTKSCADHLKWTYDEQAGNAQLFLDMLDGPWDDDRFIVVPPGKRMRFTADERIVEAV
jgi:hypothetical protein